MANTSGKIYGYTGFFPIREDAKGSGVDDLRTVLAEAADGPGSLFARTGLVHVARFFIIDDVIYNGAPSHEEHLAYSYLAVSLTFDGALEDLAAKLAQVGAPELGRVFAFCYGYPAEPNAAALLDYLRGGQVETTFLFADDDMHSLTATLRALSVQRLVSDMVLAGQGLDAPARKDLVRRTMERVAALQPPEPGGFATGRETP
jgi:hypothetical protein